VDASGGVFAEGECGDSEIEVELLASERRSLPVDISVCDNRGKAVCNLQVAVKTVVCVL